LTNNDWTPAVLLPNIYSEKTIEGGSVALTPADDPRITAFGVAEPNFRELLSRFTDAFNEPISPMVLIVRNDVLPRLTEVEAIASFRDIVALSIIPYARGMSIVYGGKVKRRIYYSNSFWFYPWMLSKDGEALVLSTPALHALHMVEQFHGQCSPDLSELEISEVDECLFEALMARWQRHYLGNRQRRQDRALFRSLNMAVQAAQLPGGIDVGIYDIGRMLSLWVSACEILAHTPPRGAGVHQVYALLNQVSFIERTLKRRRYQVNGRPRKKRDSLPCWVYSEIYKARCDFLHGNPVRKDRLNFTGAETSLFWVSPCLYRLVLTGFLQLPPMRRPPGVFYTDPQHIVERALLRARRRKKKNT